MVRIGESLRPAAVLPGLGIEEIRGDGSQHLHATAGVGRAFAAAAGDRGDGFVASCHSGTVSARLIPVSGMPDPRPEPQARAHADEVRDKRAEMESPGVHGLCKLNDMLS